jgi:AhpD family alkylhydroperoxidase
MDKLPRPYEAFREAYPELWNAYEKVGAASHDAGPLEKKNRELVKLAMAIGAKLEGAVHSHTRRALEHGAKPEEIKHVVLLGITTLGFPSMITAMTWVNDVLSEEQGSQAGGKTR